MTDTAAAGRFSVSSTPTRVAIISAVVICSAARFWYDINLLCTKHSVYASGEPAHHCPFCVLWFLRGSGGGLEVSLHELQGWSHLVVEHLSLSVAISTQPGQILGAAGVFEQLGKVHVMQRKQR